MRFHMVVLGCPKNQVDSEMMVELLRQAGHRLVDDPRRANVLVVNTCAFVQAARQESYEILMEMAETKRRNQLLVVAGCLAERHGDEVLSRVPGVDAVIGTRSWPEIASLFARLSKESRAGAQDRRPHVGMSTSVDASRGNLVASVRRRPATGAMAYLKIADGCDAACAFCAIPLIKGPQRSKPPDDILREAQELVVAGVQEIILIAQDTTAYGRDLTDAPALPQLVQAIVDAAPDLTWLRILYAYPQHVSPELVETMTRLPTVCHYLDLPLQHGHPDVLRRMRRPHDVDSVHAAIDALRQAMPDIALRSTFIVGFPGESEAEFEGLLAFMREISFDKVGIFAYSLEEGTPAVELPGRVPAEVIAERYERTMLVQQEISMARNEEQLGRELSILVEGAADDLSVGRSYRDAPEIDGLVLLPGELPVGEFARARIVGAQEYDLTAEPIE